MRLFQNSGVYRSYRPRLDRLTRDCGTFDAAISAFLDDRFGAAHLLKPILERDPSAFFANGDDEHSQRLWAKENGLPVSATLSDILLAQIEEHRTEVFYNIDPMRYGDSFLARLPGSVRRTIAWRAAPSEGGQFLKHDLVVNNFPAILAAYRDQGANTAAFFPAHDPVMDGYAAREDRDIDLLFVGSYSRYHLRRAAMLEAIASLRGTANVVMFLDRSRFTRLAETPLGWVGPLREHRRPPNIRRVAQGPVFGRDLLSAIGRAKIVVNGAIDMVGTERGNMRVWEAMGCGAALLSDTGSYPEHMRADVHFETYANSEQVVEKALGLLADDSRRQKMAGEGYAMISTAYSKTAQWEAFALLAS